MNYSYLTVFATFVLIRLAAASYCPPIVSHGIECIDMSGKQVSCEENQNIGNEVRCKPFYVSSEPSSTCGTNGDWSEQNFTCRIVCGKSRKSENGLERTYSATIYQMLKKELNAKICAGTLVADGYVLTIAHCLLDYMEQVLNHDLLLVGLGPSDTETLYKVRNVEFESHENGTKIDPDDLAILELENFTLTHDVVPVCLPKCAQMDELALEDGAIGEMFARGPQHYQKLKVKVSANCTRFVGFCAGSAFSKRGTKKCPEEIGTGITTSIGEDARFIYGILSSTSDPACATLKTFKRIFPHINWIRKASKMDGLRVPRATETTTTTTATEGPFSVPTQNLTSDVIHDNVTNATDPEPIEPIPPTPTEIGQWVVTEVPPTEAPTKPDAGVPDQFAQPPSTTVTSEVIEPTDTFPALLATQSSFESTTTEPEFDDGFFQEIPKADQLEMTNLTIPGNVKVNATTLLNSLKFAKKLKILDIRHARFDSGFDAVEELPELETYILKDVEFDQRPTHFKAYFPFFKTKNWNSSDFPNEYEEIYISGANIRRFYMKPEEGQLIVTEFPDLNVDKILNGLPSNKYPERTWKSVSLRKTQFSFSSIPKSLHQLSLSEMNISGVDLGHLLLTKAQDLESLTIDAVGSTELKIEDLPTESLKYLHLDRVQFTFKSADASNVTFESNETWSDYASFATEPTPTLPVFDNLVRFYWGLDVKLDQNILDNFSKIFPNLKVIGYFGSNNIPVLESFLKLESWEEMYLRVHIRQATGMVEGGEAIMAKLDFDLANLGNSNVLESVDLCLERKAGATKFVTKHIRPQELEKTIDTNFPSAFDIPQKCVGFS